MSFPIESELDELGSGTRATEEEPSPTFPDLPPETATGQAAQQLDRDSSARHSLPKFTIDEVAMHYEEGDCWIIISRKVYDVTSFLDTHPGGIDVIMEYAGLDATSDFEDLPHPPEAYEMLEKYLKGEVV